MHPDWNSLTPDQRTALKRVSRFYFATIVIAPTLVTALLTWMWLYPSDRLSFWVFAFAVPTYFLARTLLDIFFDERLRRITARPRPLRWWLSPALRLCLIALMITFTIMALVTRR